MLDLMVEDKELARLNRDRVKQGQGNDFYAQQARSVAQWGLAETKPESVVIGELPYAGKLEGKHGQG